jgi:hypothetical protein
MTLPPTRAFAVKSMTQIEPAYPCEDFQNIELWNNEGNGVDDSSNMECMPCEQIPGHVCRSPCDDDECIDRAHGNTSTSTTLAIYYPDTVVEDPNGVQHPNDTYPDSSDTSGGVTQSTSTSQYNGGDRSGHAGATHDAGHARVQCGQNNPTYNETPISNFKNDTLVTYYNNAINNDDGEFKTLLLERYVRLHWIQ